MMIFQYIIIMFFTFLLQLWTSEFFSLGTIDPDFCLIVLLYISIKNGGLVGTLFGFFIGLFIDLSSGSNQFFGLTPLVYTITGYFSAFLKGENEKLNKLYFTSLWIFIIFCQFLIFSLIVYQQLLLANPAQFLIKWLATSLYTLVFLGILQIMVPLYKI
ncbi:MAG: rod shape-determining protein MreD [Candidatus Neomarinimicrobiota bacterium]